MFPKVMQRFFHINKNCITVFTTMIITVDRFFSLQDTLVTPQVLRVGWREIKGCNTDTRTSTPTGTHQSSGQMLWIIQRCHDRDQINTKYWKKTADRKLSCIRLTPRHDTHSFLFARQKVRSFRLYTIILSSTPFTNCSTALFLPL